MQIHRFTSCVLRLDTGLKQHYAPIPDDVAAHYAAEKVRRVVVKVNGKEMRRAINGRKNGERYLLLGADALREFGLKYGDTVQVQMWADPEPDGIDISEEFQATLDLDEEAAKRFLAMTPGRQRSLMYYVNSAKSSDTRISRSLELAEKLRDYKLYGDLLEKEKAKENRKEGGRR